MLYLILTHVISSIFLLGTGIIALILPKRKHSRHGNIGEIYFWLLLISLPTGFLIGVIEHPGSYTAFQYVTPFTLLMGCMGYIAVKTHRGWLGKSWLYWHIQGQGGSFIGVVTATCFQTIPRVSPYIYTHYTLFAMILTFALPTIIGTCLINRTMNKWIKKPRTHSAVGAATNHMKSSGIQA